MNETPCAPQAKATRLDALRAQFALAGHTLVASTRSDGTPCLVATRWGLTRELADLDEAQAFLRQIGGSHGA